MIEGLDRVVERAEKLEQREQAKRKGGGHSINQAVHVDDTGRRWTRMVYGLIFLIILGVAGGAAFLFYMEKRQGKSPRELTDRTRYMLIDLETAGARMKLYSAGENVTPEQARDRIRETVEADLNEIQKQIDKERGVSKDGKEIKNKFVSIDAGTLKAKERLAELVLLKDAWGKPFEFTLPKPDTLNISSSNNSALSVSIPIRAVPKASRKVEK